MATIALKSNTFNFSNGLNAFGNLNTSFISSKKSSSGLTTSLSSLKNSIDLANVAVNNEDSYTKVCNAEATENTKNGSLSNAYDKLDNLIVNTGIVDQDVSKKINSKENDFYKKYSYLKPESISKQENNSWAEGWKSFKNFFGGIGSSLHKLKIKAADWCKKNWKAVVTIIIVVVAIVGLACLSLLPGGALLTAIIAGACWGAISGALIGGVFGGVASKLQGKSFWAGAMDGAFSGAISGAIGGAITGGITSSLGPALTVGKSILRGAKIGAASSGLSGVIVSTCDYYAEKGTLEGSAKKIILSGLSGALSGALVGGLFSGAQFKINEAIKFYSGTGFSNINKALRNVGVLRKGNKSTVKWLHWGLKYSSLQEDMTLYRGTSMKVLGRLQDLPPECLINSTLTEKAFMSTSSSQIVAQAGFTKDVHMVITAPKGCHAMDIASISEGPFEQEILFDYGQDMIITGAEYVGKVLHLDVTILK